MLDIVNFTLSILWILLSFLKMCGDLVDNYVNQGYGLPSGHMWLWELDHKEGRMPKNWSLCTVVLEKTPESPFDSKEIQPVNLKGNQPWVLIERTDTEAEAPVF